MSGEKSDIDIKELAEAFGSDEKEAAKNKAEIEKEINGDEKMKKKTTKNKKAIAIFAVGMIALVAGVGFLVFRLVSGPSKADAEFLISAGEWTKEGGNSVVWDFTEIGKGKLTTDDHLNDYDFIWALDGNKLKIGTKWLYELDDEFEYSLDQGAKVLTLKSGDKEVKFRVK